LFTHELRQEFVSVDYCQLTARLGRLDIHAFSFEARAESFPVSRRGNQNHPFAVRQRSGGEAADSPVEKLLILVKLNNMFRRCSIVKEASPRFVTVSCVTASTAGGLKACRGTFRLLRQVVLRGTHGQSSPIAAIGLFYKITIALGFTLGELFPAGGRAP
jgi:hypothetical protein